ARAPDRIPSNTDNHHEQHEPDCSATPRSCGRRNRLAPVLRSHAHPPRACDVVVPSMSYYRRQTARVSRQRFLNDLLSSSSSRRKYAIRFARGVHVKATESGNDLENRRFIDGPQPKLDLAENVAPGYESPIAAVRAVV